MKLQLHSAFTLAAALALTACGGVLGGGSDSAAAFCEGFHSGATVSAAEANCFGCAVQDAAAAGDGNLFSAANMDTGGTSQQVAAFKATSDSVFAKGGNAGAFVTLDEGRAQHSIVINTYLKGVPVESASDPTLNRAGTVGGTGADRYVSFSTTQAFDSVEVVITAIGTGTGVHDRIYELCGNGAVK